MLQFGYIFPVVYYIQSLLSVSFLSNGPDKMQLKDLYCGNP